MRRHSLDTVPAGALAVIGALLAPASPAAATTTGGVLFVDPDGLDGGNGSSWVLAFRHVQDALTAARAGGVSEIRVSEGTYRPDEDADDPEGTGDRDATFALVDGVGLRGGYAGRFTPDPDARDIRLYPTVLSGDLLENDGPEFGGYEENSFTVVTATAVESSAVLDGFTVTAGNATGSGAGMRAATASPTVVSCTFLANLAGVKGGGFESVGEGGDPSLAACRFEGNRARSGGGAYLGPLGNATITACSFVGNSAVFAGGLLADDGTVVLDCVFEANAAERIGGGLEVVGVVTVDGCEFRRNTAGEDGGGIASFDDLRLLDCTFTGNTATRRGGGLVACDDEPQLTRCSFDDNHARWGGGAAFDEDVLATVSDGSFTGNTALADGGGLWVNDRSDIAIDGCTFDGNHAGSFGGGLHGSVDTDLIVGACTFRGNTSLLRGGGVSVRSGSLLEIADCGFEENESVEGGGLFNESETNVDRCTFRRNAASRGGGISSVSLLGLERSLFEANDARAYGGGVASFASRPILACTFLGNTAGASGGAFYGADSDLSGCLFSGNAAGNSGGAVRSLGGEDLVVNCSFSANTAIFGGAYSSAAGGETIANSILWGNTGGSIDGPGTLTVRYSLVEGGWAGEGNVSGDPFFADADGADGVPGTADDDLRLLPGSPAIDAGDNDAVPAGLVVDLDGNPRFRDDPTKPDTGNGVAPLVDMGVYEFAGCSADLDGNGAVDFGDVLDVLQAWGPCDGCREDLDGNGAVDFGDVLIILAAWGPCPA